eukprot:EG_transcript_26784
MLRAAAPPAAGGEAMLQPARGHCSAWVLARAAPAVLCLLGGLGLPAGGTAAPSPLLRLPIYPPRAERILTGLVRKYPLFLEARLALVSSYWGRGEAALAEGAFLDAAQYEPRIESWEPAEALGYAQSREWPRRFPTLVAAWLAFVRNDPPPPPPLPPAP